MPTLIRLACPNCGYNLAEENLHSNILQCPRCNSYTYYESGMYNVNVFFGLLHSHNYRLDSLRSTLIESYVRQGSLKAIKNIKFLHAQRVLVPVREIDSEGKFKAVTLLEQSQETVGENTDVRLLMKALDNLTPTFSMQYLQPLRLNAVRDETDHSGYITHTSILPVARTKRSVDTAYNLQPDSLLRILYVPIYRIAFNDSGTTHTFFANDQLTGFPFARYTEHKGIDFEDMALFALAVSGVLTVIVDIVSITTGNVSVHGSGLIMNAFMYVLGVLLMSVILMLLFTSATLVILMICSKLSVSLNIVASVKRWLIRRTLSKRFRLNEKSK